LTNKTRRRLGFVMMVLAVISAVFNLERAPGHPAMLGTPVVFLIVGAVLLRKTRSSTSPD
jgi:hypothetical protein